MFELTTGADGLGLQSFAETAGLYGRGGHHGHGRRRRNVCLVTANHSLNGIGILNILNWYGYW